MGAISDKSIHGCRRDNTSCNSCYCSRGGLLEVELVTVIQVLAIMTEMSRVVNGFTRAFKDVVVGIVFSAVVGAVTRTVFGESPPSLAN
jgi:hypothetical protein